MARRKVRPFSIVHPDQPSTQSDRSTGEVFRPYMWEVRKALFYIKNLLEEEGYETAQIASLTDMVTVMDKDDPDRTIVLIDEFNATLYRLFIELWSPAEKEFGIEAGLFAQPKYARNGVLHILNYTLHCWLYFAGLAPKPVYKPSRHRKKARTDIWREQLTCPVCNKVFTVQADWAREEALRRYSTWLYEHSKFECQSKLLSKGDTV